MKTRPLELCLSLALGALATAAGACTPANDTGAHVADPHRRAESEYDLAKDAFYKAHLREALDHIQLATKFDDEDAKILYFAAVIYLGFCQSEGMQSPDCRLETAEDFTRRAVKADGEFRDAKNALGQILILENKYDDALKVLLPLTKDPAYVANYLAWGNYGWALVQLGRYDEAIAALRNAVTEPRFCTGQYRLGVAYQKKGDLLAAETSFGDAVSTPIAECEALQDAWIARGQVRMRLGKTAEAQADFARCRDLDAKTDDGRECAKLAGTAAPTALTPIPTAAKPRAPSMSPAPDTTATTSPPQ
jgi:Tfp pilus assembly protein PilF